MAHTLYSNVVLENKVESFLTTALDMSKYATVDYSLTESAGMVKTINKYTATGAVEDLAMGVGNTTSKDIAVAFTPVSYTVKVTQGHLPYFDEEEMKDPMVVEVGMKKLTDEMVNDLTSKIIAEFGKATLKHTMTNWNFDDFADAIAKYPYESEDGLFIMINPAEKAKVRKALGADLKYSEGFARTGYIGHVCGVPVIVSKAVPANKGYLATKDAVTVFIKKDTEVEQDRNPDTRDNKFWIRKVAVVALTDATKAVKINIGG